MRVPPEFDEAMVEAPKPDKASALEFSHDAAEVAGREVDLHNDWPATPRPCSDEYFDAMGEEIDRHPIGVPHRRLKPQGPLD